MSAAVGLTERVSPRSFASTDKRRKVTRSMDVFEADDDFKPKGWENISCIVRVVRKGIKYSKKSTNRKTKKEKKAEAAVRAAKKMEGDAPTAKVVAKAEPKGEYFEETSYYACSGKVPTPEDAFDAVLKHWHIENKLHRCKDVNFGEDNNKIANKRIAGSLSLIFNFSLNLFIMAGIKSVKYGIERYAHDIEFFMNAIFSTKGCAT